MEWYDRRGLERVFSGLENYIRSHFRDEEQQITHHILLLDRRYMPFLRSQGCR